MKIIVDELPFLVHLLLGVGVLLPLPLLLIPSFPIHNNRNVKKIK
jgi:hypothetical protein